MSSSLTRALLAVGIFLICIIIFILRNGKIPTKFGLVLLIPAFVIVLLAFFPQIFELIACFFGFTTISNLIIGFLLVLVFLIIIALVMIVADQANKINLLIQEVSLLKKRQDKER